MSTKAFAFLPGDTVRSVQVGSVAAFVGQVVEICTNADNKRFYHVGRDDGTIWHRHENELCAV